MEVVNLFLLVVLHTTSLHLPGKRSAAHRMVYGSLQYKISATLLCRHDLKFQFNQLNFITVIICCSISILALLLQLS